MDGLIIGLDLCDAYTRLCCHEREKTWCLPTVICRKKDDDEWHTFCDWIMTLPYAKELIAAEEDEEA